MSTLAAILTSEAEAPTQVVPGLSRDLDKLIVRCLRKNPERRWQSMADLKVALEDLRDESRAGHRPRAPPAVPVRRWTRDAIIAGGLDRRDRRRAVHLADAAAAGGSSQTIADAAHIGSRMDGLSGDLTRRKGSRVCVGPQRRGEPGHLGSAHSRRRARQADPSRRRRRRSVVLGGRQPDRVSVEPRGRRHLCHADTWRRGTAACGTGVLASFFSRRELDRVSGRREQAAAGSTSRQPPAVLRRRSPQSFYRAQAPVWSPDGRSLLFWGQRHRDAPPEDNVDWYVAAIPAGTPAPTSARRLLLREGFRAVQGLPFPDAWARAGTASSFTATSAIPRTCGRWHSRPLAGASTAPRSV